MMPYAKNINLDWIGFLISILCAIHCAVLPFILSLAPLAGLQFLTHPGIELIVIIFSFIVANVSLVHGYRKHHHKKIALIIVIFGFLLIGTGHSFQNEWMEISLTVAGASLVAIAHLINWKYVRASQIACPDCSIPQKIKENA
jgi:hypothetical protein